MCVCVHECVCVCVFSNYVHIRVTDLSTDLTPFHSILQKSCGPCHMIAPAYKALAKEFARRAAFLKVDVNRNHETSAACGVRSMPTFHFYLNGKLAGQVRRGGDEEMKRRRGEETKRRRDEEQREREKARKRGMTCRVHKCTMCYIVVCGDCTRVLPP